MDYTVLLWNNEFLSLYQMENQQTQGRIRAIYQMLFQMASGNLVFRIMISGEGDEIEKIEKKLNKIATKIQAVVLRTAHFGSHHQFDNICHPVFVLSESHVLQGFNEYVVQLLKYKPEELIDTKFKKLIASQSMSSWKDLKRRLRSDRVLDARSQLLFLNREQKLLPSFCIVSRLHHNNIIVVSSIAISPEEPEYFNSEQLTHTVKNESEMLALQKLRSYILDHLDEPLPSLKNLAALLASEEYKLKIGFRKYYNTSVYSFYNIERLKKSQLLIQQTRIPLKEIAFMCGFSLYHNFYRAFKKHFGYTPSDLSRPSE